jgi:hypothetical protein
MKRKKRMRSKLGEKNTGNYSVELWAHSEEEFEYKVWYTGPWGGGPFEVWSDAETEDEAMYEFNEIRGDMCVQMILANGGLDIYGNG